MKTWIPIAVLFLILGAQKRAGGNKVLSPAQSNMRVIIAKEAALQGVPARIALTFAWLESRLNPLAEGTLDWAFRRPDMYQRLVVNRPELKDNPFRMVPEKWHSYGLFQLLAPYYVNGNENPSILLDAKYNSRLGIAKIKSLLAKHNGNYQKARLEYVGATEGVSASVQKTIIENLNDAYARFRDI